MKTNITFAAAVNWQYVAAHHKRERDGKVNPGPWCERIIEHARKNGYMGKITAIGACRIINAYTALTPPRGRGQPAKEATKQIRAYSADVPRLAKHGKTQAEAVRALLTKRQQGSGGASTRA